MKGNSAVGLYSSAYRLLESTLFISYAFVAAVLPTLSRLCPTTSPTIAEAYALGLKGIVAVLLPIGTAFVLFAEPVIRLIYGDDFLPAVSAMRLLGAAAALYGVSYLGSYLLVSQDRTRVIPWVTAAVAVLNIALNLALIPDLLVQRRGAGDEHLRSLACARLHRLCAQPPRVDGGRPHRRRASARLPRDGSRCGSRSARRSSGCSSRWSPTSAIVAAFERVVFREDFDRIAAAVPVAAARPGPKLSEPFTSAPRRRARRTPGGAPVAVGDARQALARGRASLRSR